MKLLMFCLLVASVFAKEIPSVSMTQNSCQIDGQEVEYTTKTGTYTLKNEKDEPQAEIFFIAYTRNGEDQAERPITFCFNGGPGSSSIWLHMGALGPRKIVTDDLKPEIPPYKYMNNSHSILDVTDLVFIDPVSTGYSRPAKDVTAKQFHGIDEDIQSIAEFIRLYVTRNGRWKSPKYVAGESYGSTRAAGLVNFLQDRFYMNFNGLILISSALNFRTFDVTSDGNDLPFQTYLPTYSALAWYHQKLPAHLQGLPLNDVVERSKTFALGAYRQALAYGHTLSDDEKEAMTEQLSNFTGLNIQLIQKHHLRILPETFFNEILKDPKQRIGRMDGRVVGFQAPPMQSLYTDPSTDSIACSFTAAFNDYVRCELKWEKDERYGVLENVFPWNCLRKELYGYPATDQDLACAMMRNPKLRAMVACGYYDLATPFFAAEYVINHLNVDASLRKNVTMSYYPAGHMMFLHLPSLAKLKQNIAAFITERD